MYFFNIIKILKRVNATFMHAILGYIVALSELIQGDIHEFDFFILTLMFFLLLL